MKNPLTNCLTVDVEDYFQVSAFEDRVCRSKWDQFESRVEVNTNRLLTIFDNAEVRGTFFVLGWIADRYPALVRRIANSGHEIASHGYWHRLIYSLSPQEFQQDIIDSREAIFNACEIEVNAYRAPSFSMVPRSRWALEVLRNNGFKIDSSVFPIRGHDRYGDPDSPACIHTIKTKSGTIIEFPPTAGNFIRFPLPIGGGYFRLFPLWLTQKAIHQTQKHIGPAMFYIHPWEVDPDQPRVEGVSRKSRFRHYVGLQKTESKLERLLQNNSFGTLSEVLKARTEFSSATSGKPTESVTPPLIETPTIA